MYTIVYIYICIQLLIYLSIYIYTPMNMSKLNTVNCDTVSHVYLLIRLYIYTYVRSRHTHSLSQFSQLDLFMT